MPRRNRRDHDYIHRPRQSFAEASGLFTHAVAWALNYGVRSDDAHNYGLWFSDHYGWDLPEDVHHRTAFAAYLREQGEQ
jgi:hypothetical protein